jgi:hypothetical protein
MIDNDHRRRDFVEALSWMGAPPFRLLLYVVRSRSNESLEEGLKIHWSECTTKIQVHWPKCTKYVVFRLVDDDWPFEIALVEIELQQIDNTVDINISRTLQTLVAEFNTACMFMFEGGFYDYHDLFKPECQSHVFGLSIPNILPLVCTVDEERNSPKLAEYLGLARAWLIGKYPQVERTIESG